MNDKRACKILWMIMSAFVGSAFAFSLFRASERKALDLATSMFNCQTYRAATWYPDAGSQKEQ